MQDTSSSIYTSIIPVSDMTPLSGISALYSYGVLQQSINFQIISSTVQDGLVSVIADARDENGKKYTTIVLYDTNTQSLLSSISLSGYSYYNYNYSQIPSLVEIGSKKYYVVNGSTQDTYDPIITITDFNTVTHILSCSIHSIYDNEVICSNRGRYSSVAATISSINIETNDITNLGWINDYHNEYINPIPVYVTVDSYVTIHPTTFQVTCFDKTTRKVTTSFNLSSLSNAPSLSAYNLIDNSNYQKIDYFITHDKRKVYIKCILTNDSDEYVSFILYVDPSNFNDCNIIPDYIYQSRDALNNICIIITSDINILTEYRDENVILNRLDKYNTQHITTIPIYGYNEFTCLNNGIIYSSQYINRYETPFIYSIVKAGEYIGIWPKEEFLRLRLLGYF